MSKKLQISLNIQQHNSHKAVEVQSWVNTAMNAKKTPTNHECSSSRKIEVHTTFCQTIINRR